MIDSGATGNFISHKAILRLGLREQEKKQKYSLRLIDGTEIGYGKVTHETQETTMRLDAHSELINFDITDTGTDEIVLGIPWLRIHNPTINWTTGKLQFTRCNCGTTGPSRLRIPAEDEEHDQDIMRECIPDLRLKKRDLHWLSATNTDKGTVPQEYRKYTTLFKEDLPDEALPKHQPWDHEIPLIEGSTPAFQKIYPMNEEQLKALREYLDENLKKGFIRESKSPAAYPLFFVTKKNTIKLRPVVDYRQLNNITVKNRYPLPLIGEMMDRLRGAYWFTKVDLKGAYNLIRMKEGEEWKTAFRTKYGLYEYTVMPFGLTNAPATFQAFINNVLRKYLDDFVVVYLDDILIFSKTLNEHKKHVHLVLDELDKADTRASPDKCEFHKQKVEFLGHILLPNEIRMDPAKIKSILEWPIPKTVKEVQSFLGFGNYYRRFIKGYSQIVAALTRLTRKDEPFKWTEKQQTAFEALQERFTQAPVLITFDPEKQITVETDASDFAIGACLSQPDESNKLHPVAFYSRTMSPAELNYEIHDKELLAIVASFKQWKVYLEGPKHTVTVLSDHKNLVYFTTTKILNRRQVRWAEELAIFNYKIVYQPGTANARADALSRRTDYLQNKKPVSHAIFAVEPNGELTNSNQHQIAATFTITETHWKQEIKDAYANDSFAITLSKSPSKEFSQDTNGLWIIDGRVYVPTKLHHKILRELHEMDHQGVGKTMERITRHYYIPRLRSQVEQLLQRCDTCKRSKHERHKPYGLLQSLPVPEGAWKSISMDFITDLPLSRNWTNKERYDTILVIVDRLTKFAYFLAFYKKGTAEQLSQLLIERVFANHGTPDTIISDKDKLFLSKFWKTTMNMLRIKSKMSTSFHPQTDGQTERTNQTLEQYLRAFLNYQQDNWATLLPIAQFTYNTATSSSTNITPYQANYGIIPTLRFEERSLQSYSDHAERDINTIKTLHENLKMEIARASTSQTYHANKHRSCGPDLKEGDTVYLRTKNLKTTRPKHKLDHTKIGPFVIQQKLGPVTYKLKLPPQMKMHPVFHISLLERAHTKEYERPPPEISPESQQPEYEPEAILNHRTHYHKKQYLIKWRGYPNSENTWEPEAHVKHLKFYTQYKTRARL